MTIAISTNPTIGTASTTRARAVEVAQQFEAVFAKQMVQSMRDGAAIGGTGGMFGSGPGSDTYAQWFDQLMAERLTGDGEFGVADTLIREFERHGHIPTEGQS